MEEPPGCTRAPRGRGGQRLYVPCTRNSRSWRTPETAKDGPAPVRARSPPQAADTRRQCALWTTYSPYGALRVLSTRRVRFSGQCDELTVAHGCESSIAWRIAFPPP